MLKQAIRLARRDETALPCLTKVSLPFCLVVTSGDLHEYQEAIAEMTVLDTLSMSEQGPREFFPPAAFSLSYVYKPCGQTPSISAVEWTRLKM